MNYMYTKVSIGLKFADDYTRPFFPACLKSAIMRQQQSQWKEMYALIVHILIVVAKSVITIITSKKFRQQASNSLAI